MPSGFSTGAAVLRGGESPWPGDGRLAGGTAYTSPWVYAAYGTGLDGVAGRFHDYLRTRPQHPGTRRPVPINVWEAVYFDHSLPALLELAEIAAEVGVERYVLDDGWFGSRRSDASGLGDWAVSADVWPDGLHPLIDRVRELGMEFGLWVEPEMVNLDSDLARAHPEWVMGTGGRTPLPARRQQVLNLSIPACYDHIRDALSALLRDYPITYLKWDHNRDLLDAGTAPGGEAAVHAQTEAAYRLIAELKATHPGLEIESCSSGGARVDLGILEHTDRVWASDCIDPHERQQIVRWTQQLVPPELIGTHIASGVSHTTGRAHTLGFRAATAIFGHLGIEWDLRQASEAERAELAAWIELHKTHRELLFTGTLVRIDHPDTSLSGFGIVAADRSEALYSLARLDRSEVVSLGRIRLPGLDPDRTYRVTPIQIGAGPAGLTVPAWWREGGAEFSGAVLGRAGLVDARVHPDEAVIYHCEGIA